MKFKNSLDDHNRCADQMLNGRHPPKTRPFAHSRQFVCLLLILILMAVSLAETIPTELKKLSLEELVNIEVITVSRRVEKLSEAAAAIYVITAEDIRRSGFKSIPEALRMVPGMHVGRIDGNKWAITARGFNAIFANKLLVLIDGRSVYTPLFSGVYWDVQDVVMEDINRIEIIRGPGATLWGANAVNGVINIITKSTDETIGCLVKAGYETKSKTIAAARYGFKLGEKTSFRFFSQYTEFDGYDQADGSPMNDHRQDIRAGFRLDWAGSEKDNIFMRGDYYQGTSEQIYNSLLLTPPYAGTVSEEADLLGGDIVGRWMSRLSSTSEISVQFYCDYTSRKDINSSEERSTVNLDFHYSLEPTERIGVILGVGYRRMQDQTDSATRIKLIPADRTDAMYNAFVQTDMSIIPNRLKITLGSKFEHNDYTGFEVQPSGRVLWIPHSSHTLWAAISRAVRTPSRAEHSIRFDAGLIPPNPMDSTSLLTVLHLTGDDKFTSEVMTAYEAGYRIRPGQNLSFDVVGFYNMYSDLRSIGFDPVPTIVGNPPEYARLTIRARNNIKANTYGFEIAADWVPSGNVAIKATYTNFRFDITSSDEFSFQSGFVVSEDTDPEHQFGLRAAIDPLNDVNLDIGVRYVNELTVFDIDAYLTTDIRVMYRPVGYLELELGGHNLTSPSHTEFQSELNSARAVIKRTIYSSIIWRF
ncbi:MAG: TonB-dependent receptor [candidate division Zixibacteria bacterium]|nr:TonB-dependent receptor [candidate division Zixibacteria bacterium]